MNLSSTHSFFLNSQSLGIANINFNIFLRPLRLRALRASAVSFLYILAVISLHFNRYGVTNG
jgi:hypothetical protein